VDHKNTVFNGFTKDMMANVNMLQLFCILSLDSEVDRSAVVKVERDRRWKEDTEFFKEMVQPKSQVA
jgi:hypothetical protein